MTLKLFIIGLPGSGKSALARYISEYIPTGSELISYRRWLTSRFNHYRKSTASSLSEKRAQSRDSRNPKFQPGNDDKMRRFLAIWTALLMFAAFVGYLVTRDAGILVDTTFIGVAVTYVFGYYFKRK